MGDRDIKVRLDDTGQDDLALMRQELAAIGPVTDPEVLRACLREMAGKVRARKAQTGG